MLRERNQTFKLAFIGVDLILSAAAMLSALVLHFVIISPKQLGNVIVPRETFIPFKGTPSTDGAFINLSPEEVFRTYLALGLVIAFLQVVVFVATEIYHPRRGLSPLREFMAIIRGVAINLLFVLALLFFFRTFSFSRMVFVYSAFFSISYHCVGHYFFRYYLGRMRSRGFNLRRVLVLGTGPNAQRLVDVLQKHSIYGYVILGVIGPSSGVEAPFKNLIKGPLNSFKKLARELEPDLIVFAVPGMKAGDKLREVVDFCDDEGIDIRLVPDFVDYITHRARIEAMDGIPILSIRDIPLKNGYYRFMKRSFDILFAATALFFASPIMVLTALLVKITSRGPILFSQERMGLDRQLFKVHKFRSMRVQAVNESDTTWGSSADSRVTMVGNFIRKTSLDELPQLLNVLAGDMSIVGPRPERPHFVSEFKTRYHHYMRRHNVQAGLTGWAQIQGLRGDTSIQKRVEADIYYIENWSFWLDIIIILRTIPSMIKNPGE